MSGRTNCEPGRVNGGRTTTVSVVIPAYNGSEYLCESIASVRGQRVKDVEIIVVDDASNDGALQRLEGNPLFAGVRVLRHAENHGPGESRRTGIRAARGAYIAFLDADDLFEPEFLGSGLAILDRDPTVGLFCCDGLLMDAGGSVLDEGQTFNRINASIKRYPLRTGLRSLEEIFMFSTIGIGFLVRREVFDRVSYPSDRRLEDYRFQLDVAAAGFQVYYLHEPLARYRIHQGNASGADAAVGMCEEMVTCLQDARARYAPLRHLGRRAAGRLSDVRMDLGISYLKDGHGWRGLLAVGRAVAGYPPQAVALIRFVWGWLLKRTSRQPSHATGQMG